MHRFDRASGYCSTKNGESALSKIFVDLCRFLPIGQRNQVDKLQVQARAVNTALNSLVIYRNQDHRHLQKIP